MLGFHFRSNVLRLDPSRVRDTYLAKVPWSTQCAVSFHLPRQTLGLFRLGLAEITKHQHNPAKRKRKKRLPKASINIRKAASSIPNSKSPPADIAPSPFPLLDILAERRSDHQIYLVIFSIHLVFIFLFSAPPPPPNGLSIGYWSLASRCCLNSCPSWLNPLPIQVRT